MVYMYMEALSDCRSRMSFYNYAEMNFIFANYANFEARPQ